MTSRQRNIPQSACPVCGASLPHTTPMSREYHEGVARRSQEGETKKKQAVYQEKEVVQGSAEGSSLEQAGWRYFRTYHDIDKASTTYGKRIDIYLLKKV